VTVPVSAPSRLADQAFLLAYDAFRGKLIDHQWYLVRAAVLSDLFLLGRLIDQDGHPVAIEGPVDDPISRSTLDEIAASPPRTWQEWVVEDAWATYSGVRRRLMTDGHVVEENKKILGFVRSRKITVGDAAAVERLISEVRTAVLIDSLQAAAASGDFGAEADAAPDSVIDPEVDPAFAALVAIADALDLRSVFTWEESRRYRDRIDDLGAPIRPITTGARAALVDVAQQAMRSTGPTLAGG
jgi:hypothetical protein